MELSPHKETPHYDKFGFLVQKNQQLAISYLLDPKAQELKLQKWQNLLPKIRSLQEGGREEQRQLIMEVRRGIEDSLRPKVWPMLIQKPIRSFDECKGKADLKDIALDLERTFPSHKQGKQLEDRMRIVLNSLAVAMPEVGYCQGMNFIVGILLLKLNDEQAFNMAYHIFHWEGHDKLMTNLSLIHEKLYALDKLTQKLYPQLYKHLKNHEVDAIVYASSWFITLYCNCLPASYAFRILESLLLQGEKVIYRVALQILKKKKHYLKSLKQVQQIVEEIKNYGEFLDSNIDEFFDGMYQINLSRQEINRFRERFREKQNQ